MLKASLFLKAVSSEFDNLSNVSSPRNIIKVDLQLIVMFDVDTIT